MSLSEPAKALGMVAVAGALLVAYAVGEREGRNAERRNADITEIVRGNIARQFAENMHELSDPKKELKIDLTERMQMINGYTKEVLKQKPVK